MQLPHHLLNIGRAAEKLGNLCKLSFELGSFDAISQGDIQSFFLKVTISKEIDPYGSGGKHFAPSLSEHVQRGSEFGGLSRATMGRMQSCLQKFEEWLQNELGINLEAALCSAEMANLALRGYGEWLFSGGKPRYLFVYTVTGVQRLRPEMRSLLSGAWHIDRMWQLEERTWSAPSRSLCSYGQLFCVLGCCGVGSVSWEPLRWASLACCIPMSSSS